MSDVKRIVWDRVAGGFIHDIQQGQISITNAPASAKMFSERDEDALKSLVREEPGMGLSSGSRYTIYRFNSLDDLRRLTRTPDKSMMTLQLEESMLIKIKPVSGEPYVLVLGAQGPDGLTGSDYLAKLLSENKIATSENIGIHYVSRYLRETENPFELHGDITNSAYENFHSALSAAYQQAHMAQLQSYGADCELMQTFLMATTHDVRNEFLPVSLPLEEALRRNPLPPIDYTFLKVHNPTQFQRARDIDFPSDEKGFSYCVDDERTAMRESKNTHDVVFALSVGHKNEESPLSFCSSIESVRDIAEELEEAFESISHMVLSDSESIETPMFSFTVNNAVNVNGYYDSDTDSMYIQMFADEIIATNKDISDARRQAISTAEGHGYYGANEEKSFIRIGNSQISFFGDVPKLSGFEAALSGQNEMLHQTSEIHNSYSKLGLCHLYKNGACIARVSLNGIEPTVDNIILEHPRDGVIFTDLSHAESYVFGISAEIDRPTAEALGINGGRSTTMAEEVDKAMDSHIDHQSLCYQLSRKHACSAKDVNDAFWDMFSGKVYGKDLRQHERLASLYMDIARETPKVFPKTSVVCDLWKSRMSDLISGISPNARKKLDANAVKQDAPLTKNQNIEVKPSMRR